MLLLGNFERKITFIHCKVVEESFGHFLKLWVSTQSNNNVDILSEAMDQVGDNVIRDVCSTNDFLNLRRFADFADYVDFTDFAHVLMLMMQLTR